MECTCCMSVLEKEYRNYIGLEILTRMAVCMFMEIILI